MFSKLLRINCPLKLLIKFIQIQKRYPTYLEKNNYSNLKTTCRSKPKIFFVNLTPWELTPSKISHICYCISHNWLKVNSLRYWFKCEEMRFFWDLRIAWFTCKDFKTNFIMTTFIKIISGRQYRLFTPFTRDKEACQG